MIPHHVSLSINCSHGGDRRTRVQMVPPKCPLLLVSHVSNLMNHPNAAKLGVLDPVFFPLSLWVGLADRNPFTRQPVM